MKNPTSGEIIVSNRLAKKQGFSAGDIMEEDDTRVHNCPYMVSGIFKSDNFIAYAVNKNIDCIKNAFI